MPATNTQIVNNGVPIIALNLGGTFWGILQNQAFSPAKLQAYSSPDGIVWTHQDAADEVTSPGWNDIPMVGFFDGSHTCTFLYQQGAFSGNTFLVQFDLSAKTWGAPFAEQSPGNFGPQFLGKLSSGDLIAVIQDQTVIGAGALYKAQTWDGATWSGLTDICAGIEALSGFDPTKTEMAMFSGVLDGSDVLHCVIRTTSSDPTWNNRYFYQEVTGALALQHFQEFPGQSGASQDIAPMNVCPAPNLFIAGGVLYWGIIRNNTGAGAATFPAVYKGSPVVNPVFSESPNLDPAATALQAVVAQNAPCFFSNAGQIYLSFIRGSGDGENGQNQAIVTSNGFASSVSETLSDSATGGPLLQYQSSWILFGSLFLVTGTAVVEGNSHVDFFFSSAPILAPILKITFRGVKRVKCRPEELQDLPPTPPHVKRAW